MPQIHPPITVSVKTAGEMVGLSSWQVRQLLEDGLVVSRYQGRRRLVDVDSLRSYIESLPTERPGGAA